MKVHADSPRAVKSQNMVLEMLLSDLPEKGYKWLGDDATRPHGELSDWASRQSVQVRPALAAISRTRRAAPSVLDPLGGRAGHSPAQGALTRRSQPAPDVSHPAMAVNLDACIQCNRCVRACREEQVNDVIGYAFRGHHSEIVFDLHDPMGDSTCVACGECVQACPTGALMPKTHIGAQTVDRQVDSVCPFCGVGCQITYNVKDEIIVSVDGRDGPANHGRCASKAALASTTRTTRNA